MAAPQIVDTRGQGAVQVARMARRLAVAAATRPAVGAAVRSAARLVDSGGARHQLMPAAVRVERTKSRGRRGETSEQTALTLWFGEGPSLPVPGGARGRMVAGTALALVGAAAIGAATYLGAGRSRPGLGEPRLPRAAPSGERLIPAATAAPAS